MIRGSSVVDPILRKARHKPSFRDTCLQTTAAIFERVTSPLEALLRWYESADDRCQDKIFGDIFVLAFGSCNVRSHGDFPAHDRTTSPPKICETRIYVLWTRCQILLSTCQRKAPRVARAKWYACRAILTGPESFTERHLLSLPTRSVKGSGAKLQQRMRVPRKSCSSVLVAMARSEST